MFFIRRVAFNYCSGRVFKSLIFYLFQYTNSLATALHFASESRTRLGSAFQYTNSLSLTHTHARLRSLLTNPVYLLAAIDMIINNYFCLFVLFCSVLFCCNTKIILKARLKRMIDKIQNWIGTLVLTR